MKHPFIVLEGLSGSGKTTVGKLLARSMDGVFLKTPTQPFSSVRSRIDQNADITARFLFYLAGIFQSSTEIVRLRRHQPVVCDRYILSTICFHRAMGVRVDEILSEVKNLIELPDLCFQVNCSSQKRIQRLRKRGLSFNDKMERRALVEKRFNAEYRKEKILVIDNSTDDPTVALNSMLATLRSHKLIK